MLEAVLRSTVVAIALAVLPAAAEAQGKSARVPDSHRPPPGMCRIWVDGVPAGQQPAPTDCASALRNPPANGRVIFGERRPDRGAEPLLPEQWRSGKVPRQEERRRDEPRREEPRREEPRREETRREEPRRESPKPAIERRRPEKPKPDDHR